MLIGVEGYCRLLVAACVVTLDSSCDAWGEERALDWGVLGRVAGGLMALNSLLSSLAVVTVAVRWRFRRLEGKYWHGIFL